MATKGIVEDLVAALDAGATEDARYALDDLHKACAAAKHPEREAAAAAGQPLLGALARAAGASRFGGADDVVCAAFYEWLQKSVRPLEKKSSSSSSSRSSSSKRASVAAARGLVAAVVVPLLPVFVTGYLAARGVRATVPGLTALLLGLHNSEAVRRGNSPRSLVLPILSRPSVYHDPAVVAADAATSTDESGPFPVAMDLPLQTTTETSWASMSVVLATCLDVFYEAVEARLVPPAALTLFCGCVAAMMRGPVAPDAEDISTGHVAFDPEESTVIAGAGHVADQAAAWSDSYDSGSDAFFDAEDGLPAPPAPVPGSGADTPGAAGRPLNVSLAMHNALARTLHHLLSSGVTDAPDMVDSAIAAVDAMYARAALDVDSAKLVACMALRSLAEPAKAAALDVRRSRRKAATASSSESRRKPSESRRKSRRRA